MCVWLSLSVKSGTFDVLWKKGELLHTVLVWFCRVQFEFTVSAYGPSGHLSIVKHVG